MARRTQNLINQNKYIEHDYKIPNYRNGGIDTGLPVGSLRSTNNSIQKAHKYFNFHQWRDQPNTEFDCLLTCER